MKCQMKIIALISNITSFRSPDSSSNVHRYARLGSSPFKVKFHVKSISYGPNVLKTKKIY